MSCFKVKIECFSSNRTSKSNCLLRKNVNMAMSKQKLAGALEKKTLSLNNKQFLDFTEVFKIGKTAATNIIKKERKLREHYELFHEI